MPVCGLLEIELETFTWKVSFTLEGKALSCHNQSLIAKDRRQAGSFLQTHEADSTATINSELVLSGLEELPFTSVISKGSMQEMTSPSKTFWDGEISPSFIYKSNQDDSRHSWPHLEVTVIYYWVMTFGVKTMRGYYSAREVLWTGSLKPSPAASSPGPATEGTTRAVLCEATWQHHTSNTQAGIAGWHILL